MQISFISNQTLDFKTYDEINKNQLPFCNATRCIQETDETQKQPQNLHIYSGLFCCCCFECWYIP